MLFTFLFLNVMELTQSKTISDTITLSPLGEVVESFKMHDDDILDISITVTSGSVDVMIVDSENYPSITYYEEYYSDISSSFNTEFEALWTDNFYIIIYNPDTTNSASLTYTLIHDEEFSSNLIINLSIGAALLGMILVLNFTGKK